MVSMDFLETQLYENVDSRTFQARSVDFFLDAHLTIPLPNAGFTEGLQVDVNVDRIPFVDFN